MSKIKINDKPGKFLKGISASLKKKGNGSFKLKTSKKEKKVLKAGCPHHYLGKKGKPKAALERCGDIMRCRICGAEINLKFYNDEKINEAVEAITAINNQAKYIAVASGYGSGAADYLGEMGVALSRYPKTYRKLRDSVKKRNKIKNNNKNKNKSGSSQYGSWSTR